MTSQDCGPIDASAAKPTNAATGQPSPRFDASALPVPITRPDVLSELEASLSAQTAKGRPPLEKWSPPDRGDIGLEILADGTWLYEGDPITRPGLIKMFASVMDRDAEGRVTLVTPSERVTVTVADVPFLAVEMEVRGEGREQDVLLRTNLDDVVHVQPAHALRFAGDPAREGLKPYVHVRRGLEARLNRSLYYELVARSETAEINDVAWIGVWSGGAFFPMAPEAVVVAAAEDITST